MMLMFEMCKVAKLSKDDLGWYIWFVALTTVTYADIATLRQHLTALHPLFAGYCRKHGDRQRRDAELRSYAIITCLQRAVHDAASIEPGV